MCERCVEVAVSQEVCEDDEEVSLNNMVLVLRDTESPSWSSPPYFLCTICSKGTNVVTFSISKNNLKSLNHHKYIRMGSSQEANTSSLDLI